MITGEDFFRSFSYWEEEIRYNYVNVYTSWEAEYAATGQQVTAALKTSVSGGGFTDRAAQRAEAREEMLRVLGTYALAGGFVVLILLILLVQSLRQDLEQQRERIRLWQELGLSDTVLLSRYRLESLADSLGSILISGLYLFGSWLYAWREQGADALDYVLGNIVPYYPWALHVLAAMLCLFLFLGIYYWPVRRFILAEESHSAARRRKRRKSCTESET
ncbi:MAG: hypothetical protein LUC27_00190 [Lachnospiraceae bacterium]|nr:hypothetical protein [Lachnospiraceae bacterium]